MPDAIEGTSYEVVPDALRGAQKAWEAAKVEWEFFQLVIRDDLVMRSGDMGLLGREQNFPEAYNGARAEIEDKLSTGARALQDSSDELDAVATEYESKDAAYYEKFGYLGEKLG
jgi:hypothetical protein